MVKDERVFLGARTESRKPPATSSASDVSSSSKFVTSA